MTVASLRRSRPLVSASAKLFGPAAAVSSAKRTSSMRASAAREAILSGDADARRGLMALASPVRTPEATYDAHAHACCALLNRIAAAVPREGTVGWRDCAEIAHLETLLRDAATIIGA